MAIFRGTGGSGVADNQAGINEVAEDSAAAQNAASEAASSASSASSSASSASSSASAAASSASAAQTAQAAAEAAKESIDGLYLGALATDPTLDGNGDPVTTGDWYFNTTSNQTRIYDGSAWEAMIVDVIDDTSPQLGGDLDLNSYDITGTGNIDITGDITLSGTVDGVDIHTLNITAGSALQNVVEDTSPELGGNLDLNSNNIVGLGQISISGNTTSQDELVTRFEFKDNASSGTNDRGKVRLDVVGRPGSVFTTDFPDFYIRQYVSGTTDGMRDRMQFDGDTGYIKLFDADGDATFTYNNEGRIETTQQVTTHSGFYSDQEGNNTTNVGQFIAINDEVNIGSSTSTPVVFNVGNLEKARLTTDGYLGINNSNPSSELDVNGTVTVNGHGIGRFLAKTANTGFTANKYHKIARVTLEARGDDYTVTGSLFTSPDGQTELNHEVFEFSVYQSNAFGSDPWIHTHQFANGASVNDLGYVIVQNTPTTIVDLYVKITTGFTATNFWTNAESFADYAEWYDDASGSTTQPTGWVAGDKYSNWNTSNDGSGSGLDADLLDGNHASAFVAVSGDSMTGNLSFGDNNKATFGASDDLQIFHYNNQNFINSANNMGLYFYNDLVSFNSEDGTYETLALDNANNKIVVYTNMEFGDNDKAIFGAGSDLQIYHDGSNNRIYSSQTLYLGGNSTVIMDPTFTERQALFGNNGAVTLYYDNASKLSTTSTGIDVTGTVTADTHIQVDGASASLYLMESDTTDLNTRIRTSNGDLIVDTTNDAQSTVTNRFRIDHATGDISFYEDTGTTPKFFWDASLERLGLGTTSLTRTLHVNSGTTDIAARFESSDASVGIEFADSNTVNEPEIKVTTDDLTFRTGAAERMRIDSSGRVGIGTSSPSYKLHIEDGASPVFGMVDTTYNCTLLMYPQNTSAIFGTYSAHPLLFYTDSTEAMRIDSSGNVGIGTSSPSTTLAIGSNATGGYNGGVLLNRGASTYNFYEASDGTNSVIFGLDNNLSNAKIGTVNSYPVGFYTGNTERMRIDSSGNVGIGSVGSVTGTGLEVNKQYGGVTLEGGGATFAQWNGTYGIYPRAGVGLGLASAVGISFEVNGTRGTSASEAMRIDSSGRVGIGTSSIGYPFHCATRAGFSANQNVGTMLTGTGGLGGLESVAASSSDAAFMAFHRPGNFAAYFGLDTDNWFAVGGWSYGSGLGDFKCRALSKSSGSFKIDHPLKPETHHLVHSFVEAPQADNIYRGKVELVNGAATVNIDTVAGMTEGTFAALNREVQCFTTNESGWTAIKGSVSGNILTIEAQENTCTDTISWMVIGERQDQHMYDTDWTDENGKVIVEPEKVEEAEGA